MLDTPPTTNALDFLEAPERLASFFSDRVMKRFAPQSQAGSWASRLWNRAGASVLTLLSRVAGDTFVEDVVGFVGTFGDLFGHFRARGIEVGKTLRDPRTRYVIVCAPDPNRLAEARAIDARLAESGTRAHAFIVNRVDEPFLPESGSDEALERATVLLGGTAERERVRVFISRLEAMRRIRDSAAATHARALQELRDHAQGRPVFTAPRVPPGESPRAALLALYVGLFAGGANVAAQHPTAGAPLPRAAEAAWASFGRRATDRR
jgi:anion-transporting  ArsA/GET3 family ATPase